MDRFKNRYQIKSDLHISVNLCWLPAFLAFVFTITGCGTKGKTNRLNAGINIIEAAQNLSIFECEEYDEVCILDAKGREAAHYVLVNRNNPEALVKAEKTGATIISVPIERAVLDSEVYASALKELGQESMISGMLDTEFVTIPSLIEKIRKGEVTDIGKTDSPNLEKLMSLNPEIILISYYAGMQTQGLEKSGVSILKMYDLQEPTPLGRAEWIRLLGRLTGKKEKADSIFHSVSTNYNMIKQQQSSKGENIINDKKFRKPKVLTEIMYGGTWYVPGGNSYQSRIIADADGNYFMSEEKEAVTLNLSPEQVLVQGGDADIWLIRHYGDAEELMKILESDPIYRDIKAYKEGKVYWSDTSTSGIFLEFPFHPDLLLNDYCIIFQGKDVNNLRYFKPLVATE